MTTGQHKASVIIETKVEGQGREIAKLTKKIDKMEAAIDKSAKAATRKERAVKRLRKELRAADSRITQMSKGLGRAGMAGAAAIAATAVVELVQRSEELADTAINNKAVFDNLTIAIEPARRATQGYITDIQLAETASQAVALGLTDSAGGFAEIAGALQKLGMSRGIGALAGIESGIAALGRGSTEMLDNLGIALKVNQAQEQYAEKLGIAKKELSAVQKQEAFRVIGQEKIIEAARGVTVTADGAASAVKKFHVALDNLETRALGGEAATVNLRKALVELDREQAISIKQIQLYGSESQELETKLANMGVAYGDLTGDVRGYVAILRQARLEQARQVRENQVRARRLGAQDPIFQQLQQEAADAAASSARRTQEHEDKQRIRDIELETAALEGSKKARGAISDLMTEQSEIQARMAESSGDLEKAEGIRHRNNIRLIKEETKAAKGANKEVKSLLEKMLEADRKLMGSFTTDLSTEEIRNQVAANSTPDPFGTDAYRAQIAERERLIEQERQVEAVRQSGLLQDRLNAIEVAREMGADPMQQIADEEQARLAHNDFMASQADTEAQRLQLQNQRRQIAHDAEMKRLGQVGKAQQKRMALVTKVGAAVGRVYESMATAALTAAISEGKSVKEAVHGTAKAEALRATIMASSSYLQGLFWAVIPGGQPKAAIHFANAAFMSAQAAGFGVIAGSTAGGGGGSSRSVAGVGGQALPGASLPSQQPAASSSLPGSDSDVPGSPVATGRPGAPSAAPSGRGRDGGGVDFRGATVHLYGTPEDDFMSSIRRGLDEQPLKRRSA